jgi:hypothetical protein
LNELRSDSLIEILIANPSKLHFGQEVHHCDPRGLDYKLGDTRTPYPNIEEDMEFTTVLIVKQKLEENFSLEVELYSSVWTLETNTFRHQ